MSNSIYIICEDHFEKNVIKDLLFKNFEGINDVYIGDNLPYVTYEFRENHIGFQTHSSRYINYLCIICLSIIAKKKKLKVYWDETDLNVHLFDDTTLNSYENFISRYLRTIKKLDSWEIIKTWLLFKIMFFFEKRSVGRKNIKMCNNIIDKFKTLN